MDLHGLAWTDMDVRAGAEAAYIRRGRIYPARQSGYPVGGSRTARTEEGDVCRWWWWSMRFTSNGRAACMPPLPPRVMVAGGGCDRCGSRRTGGRRGPHISRRGRIYPARQSGYTVGSSRTARTAEGDGCRWWLWSMRLTPNGRAACMPPLRQRVTVARGGCGRCG